MLPLPIADAATAVRICGCRIYIHHQPRYSHIRTILLSTRYATNHHRCLPDIQRASSILINKYFVNSLLQSSLGQEPTPKLHTSTIVPPNYYRRELPIQPTPRYTTSSTSGEVSFNPFTKLSTNNAPTVAPVFLAQLSTIDPSQELRIYRSIFYSKPRPKPFPWKYPGNLVALEALRGFRKALKFDKPLDEVFRCYTELPGERLPYLSRPELEQLITRFMTVPIRDQTTMLQYLSILDDMKACEIKIHVNEWNQAMSFITKASKYTTSTEVQAAFELFSQAESDHNFEPDITTFNILLYGAMKSGSIEVVDQLLMEISKREIQFDRFTYTTLITHCGIRGDAEGASNVYKNMIQAGEVVDTVVLNALMTALIRCEKLSAAENLYTFMKQAGSKDSRPPFIDDDWRISRFEAQKYKKLVGLQHSSIKIEPRLGPDSATFGLLVLCYSLKGNWGGLQVILADMSIFRVPVGKATYAALLKGFTWYGSPETDVFNPWSKRSLEGLLREIMDAQIEWDRQMCIAVVKATTRFYYDVEVLEKLWSEISDQLKARGGSMHDTAKQVYDDARSSYYGIENGAKNKHGGASEDEKFNDESWETQLRKVFLDG